MIAKNDRIYLQARSSSD